MKPSYSFFPSSSYKTPYPNGFPFFTPPFPSLSIHIQINTIHSILFILFPIISIIHSHFMCFQISHNDSILFITSLYRITLLFFLPHTMLPSSFNVIFHHRIVILLFHHGIQSLSHPHSIPLIHFHHSLLSILIIRNHHSITILSHTPHSHSILIHPLANPLPILILPTHTILIMQTLIILSNTQHLATSHSPFHIPSPSPPTLHHLRIPLSIPVISSPHNLASRHLLKQSSLPSID